MADAALPQPVVPTGTTARREGISSIATPQMREQPSLRHAASGQAQVVTCFSHWHAHALQYQCADVWVPGGCASGNGHLIVSNSSCEVAHPLSK
jgi:hypothetical protein